MSLTDRVRIRLSTPSIMTRYFGWGLQRPYQCLACGRQAYSLLCRSCEASAKERERDDE